MSLAMLRTTEPFVGISTVCICSVFGSNATIFPVIDSLNQMRPSEPIAMPYGRLFSSGVAHSRTARVFGSSMPSLPRA